MKHWLTLLLPAVFLLYGCQASKSRDAVDWRVTLAHQDTGPYGSSLAYESLPDFFPNAHLEILSKKFRYTSIDAHLYGTDDSASLLILAGLDFHISKKEWGALLQFAASGNEIFLLSSNLDDRIGKALGISKQRFHDEQEKLNAGYDGSSEKGILKLKGIANDSFGYQGRSISAFFIKRTATDSDTDALDEAAYSEADLTQARYEAMIETPGKTLGTAKGKPDFIRFTIGKGHITLHAAPLVCANYFLLQPGNEAYLNGIWHSFPANISRIFWNEYFNRTAQQSSLSVLLKYPATRRAILLAAIALLLYVLIGLKRRQRMIPLIPQTKNSSVSFAETVGQLYFNKGNHENLAEKMLQHFLDHVRSKYFIDTSIINEDFATRLAGKSGRSIAEVKNLVSKIHYLRLGGAVSAEYLYQFYHDLQKFYPSES